MSISNDIKIELIPIFVTIMETLSLTETAKRHGVTQSAVSHSLKKLREQLNDDLVIREGNRLTPTVKAEQMYPQLKKWIGELNHIVDAVEFNPKSSEKIFYIATTDLIEQLYLPKIILYLKKHAPFISIRIIRWSPGQIYAQLNNSEIDLAIGVGNFEYPNLMQKVLYKEVFSSAVKIGHPILNGKITVESFLAYPHTMTSSGDREKGIVDIALEKINRKRVLSHTVANFSSAPYIVENSDCILTAPRRFLEFSKSHHKIHVFNPPIEIPGYQLKLFWIRKYHQDNAHAWLRSALDEILK